MIYRKHTHSKINFLSLSLDLLIFLLHSSSPLASLQQEMFSSSAKLLLHTQIHKNCQHAFLRTSRSWKRVLIMILMTPWKQHPAQDRLPIVPQLLPHPRSHHCTPAQLSQPSACNSLPSDRLSLNFSCPSQQRKTSPSSPPPPPSPQSCRFDLTNWPGLPWPKQSPSQARLAHEFRQYRLSAAIISPHKVAKNI